MNQDVKKTIGEQIRKAREGKGLSQADLAHLVGKTRNAISSYETGAHTPPATELPELADILTVPLTFFFGQDDFETAVATYEIELTLKQLPPPFRKLAIHQLHLVVDLYDVLTVGVSERSIRISEDWGWDMPTVTGTMRQMIDEYRQSHRKSRAEKAEKTPETPSGNPAENKGISGE
ncbi:MAG: helix-turn-helix transcriptional regulator [Chloroflexota bacterium]